jgi:hypothetical protein
MLAFFGLGTQELIILALLGAVGLGGVLVIIWIVTRTSGTASEGQTALEEENRRLRAELDRDRPPPA